MIKNAGVLHEVLFDTLITMYLQVDTEGYIYFCELETTAEQPSLSQLLLNKNVLELLPSGIHTQVCAALLQVQHERRTLRMEYTLPWQHQLMSFDMRFFPADHKHVSVFIQNTTVQKKRSSDLETLKFALDQAAIISISNVKGEIIYANETFCKVSQYNEQELLGQDHRLLNSGYHNKEFFREMWQTIAKGQVWQGEIKNKAKDGSFYWVHATIVPFLNDQGRPYQYVAIRFDITNRKEAEEKLRRTQHELQLQKYALDQSAIVAITNRRGEITYVNQKFCEISGYQRDELLGQDHRLLNSGYHERSFFKEMWKTIGQGDIWRGSIKNRGKSGQYYWVDTTIVPLIGENGRPEQYLAIRFEITEQKRLKEELIEHNLRLEETVADRTRELWQQKQLIQEANEELSAQNEELHEKNLYITNSINYALRIQQAMLPLMADIRRTFADSFILFKPKDVVSGDFYWYEEVGELALIAAVDCTGHGVPGAFMSMIGNTLLNKIVVENGIVQPAEILTALHREVRTVLKQKDNENRDGMDIALCVYNKKNRVLEFAGANNPLYMIQNGQINMIKGDRGGIGGRDFDLFVNFTNHRVVIEEATELYIFSDGFSDQFGGEQNRKITSPRFREWLMEIYQLPMCQQAEKLESFFENWKGNGKQIDDVLVIGMRLAGN